MKRDLENLLKVVEAGIERVRRERRDRRWFEYGMREIRREGPREMRDELRRASRRKWKNQKGVPVRGQAWIKSDLHVA